MFVRLPRRLPAFAALGVCLLAAACGVTMGTPPPPTATPGSVPADSESLVRRTPVPADDGAATPVPTDWSSPRSRRRRPGAPSTTPTPCSTGSTPPTRPTSYPPPTRPHGNAALALTTPDTPSGGLTRKHAAQATEAAPSSPKSSGAGHNCPPKSRPRSARSCSARPARKLLVPQRRHRRQRHPARRRQQPVRLGGRGPHAHSPLV